MNKQDKEWLNRADCAMIAHGLEPDKIWDNSLTDEENTDLIECVLLAHNIQI